MSNDQSLIITRLQEAAKGLLFPSEADHPIEPFILEKQVDEPLSPERFIRAAHLPAEEPVKELELDRFFARTTREQEWHNAEERETVRRFRELVKLLKENLSDVKVFKVGEVESDVYVVGKTPTGSLAGVKTTVVET